MLSYGCTRLEIGLQSIYEDVARDTNRGHTVAAVGECFRMAKDAGFKVRTLAGGACKGGIQNYAEAHTAQSVWMPRLPGVWTRRGAPATVLACVAPALQGPGIVVLCCASSHFGTRTFGSMTGEDSS